MTEMNKKKKERKTQHGVTHWGGFPEGSEEAIQGVEVADVVLSFVSHHRDVSILTTGPSSSMNLQNNQLTRLPSSLTNPTLD